MGAKDILAGRYPAVVTAVRIEDPTGRKPAQVAIDVRLPAQDVDLTSRRQLGATGAVFSLTKGRREGLRRFAQALDVDGNGPVEDVVAELQGIGGLPVIARVQRTKVGQHVSLTIDSNRERPANIQSVSGEVVEYGPQTLAAQHAHEQLLEGKRQSMTGLAQMAHACFELQRTEGWVTLGYDSMRQYLASPEVSLAKSQFYALAGIWQVFVVTGGVEPQRLIEADVSKLETTLPAIRAGAVSAEEGLSDATVLGLRDLRAKYRGEPGPEDDQPSVRPDPDPGAPVPCPHCGSVLSDDELEAMGVLLVGPKR